LRVIEIETAIENLITSHRNGNNFYNEPSFARQLQRLLGDSSKVPKAINKKYILTIVEVFLTNAHGVANNAEPIYKELISTFDSNQANIAVLSFNDDTIANKLQFFLCQSKFRELIQLLNSSITSPPVKELIQKIETFPGRLDYLKNDKLIKISVESLKVLLA